MVACGSDHPTEVISAAATVAAASAKPTATASAAPSAKVSTKGPLPTGYTQVPLPADAHVGIQVAMVLTATDDPIVFYITGDEGKQRLELMAWDADGGKWKGPTVVDTIASVFKFGRQVDVSRDKSNGELGVVYQKAEGETWLAMSSDSGANWRKEKLPAVGSASYASIALSNTVQHISIADGEGVHYLRRSARTGDFQSIPAPTLEGTELAQAAESRVRVDADGNPGVIYFLKPKEGYDTLLAFFRPDEGVAHEVFDSKNKQNDAQYLDLAFDGKKAIAVAALHRSDEEKSSVWVSSSEDGKAWSEPAAVPYDGGQATDGFQGLAVGNTGVALVAPVTGGNLEGTKCGLPKIYRSTDLKAWTSCSPDAKNEESFGTDASAVAFDSAGKLYVAFTSNAAGPKHPTGLYVWRE